MSTSYMSVIFLTYVSYKSTNDTKTRTVEPTFTRAYGLHSEVFFPVFYVPTCLLFSNDSPINV